MKCTSCGLEINPKSKYFLVFRLTTLAGRQVEGFVCIAACEHVDLPVSVDEAWGIAGSEKCLAEILGDAISSHRHPNRDIQ